MEATNGIQRNYVSSSTPPGVNDDQNSAYFQGSLGIVTSTLTAYICTDSTPGAAVWKQLFALNSSGDFAMPSGGIVALDRATLAAAGSTQSDAAPIVSQIVVVTGADLTKGVALPAASTSEGAIFVYNDSNSRLPVYPVNGGDDQINAIAANGAFRMAGGTFAIFTPVSATQWYVETTVAGTLPRPLTRSTVSNAANITVPQLQGGVLFQDASAGSVTMTTPSASSINTNTPELRVGDGIDLWLSSNHASNTSTIAGGTSVTLVGSGAVTNTGGQFKLIKTAATPTFDLVRVG